MDIIADKVVNKLVTNDNLNTKLNEYILKSMMSNIQTNNTENIPTSALVYNMDNILSSTNNILNSTEIIFTNTIIGITCSCVRKGNQIHLQWSGFLNTTLYAGTNSHHVWGTIPEKYRPSREIIMTTLTSTSKKTFQFAIKDGNVCLMWVYEDIIPAATDQMYQYMTYGI